MHTSPLRHALAVGAALALSVPVVAQQPSGPQQVEMQRYETREIEIVSSSPDEAYVEMTPEELRSLVGRVQRLRVQRAKQYAYLRAQREGLADVPAPASNTAALRVAPAAGDDARLREIDRDIDALTQQIALMRRDIAQGAFRQNTVATPSYREPDYRERDRRDDFRRDEDYRVTDRRDDVDLRLRDERARADRDLADERERYRRLEREYDELRRARNDAPSTVGRGLGYANPGLGYNGYPRSAGPGYTVRDTVYVDRTGERVVVRDTIRDTRVVTRDISDDRVDLAAVLFAHNSTLITPAAELQLREAVEAYRRQPSSTLLLRGFASRVGDLMYNQRLSSRRAEAVRDYLTNRGVPASQIRMIANGEDPTDHLASGRRVEIQLLPR